jgi:hypothetical protein
LAQQRPNIAFRHAIPPHEKLHRDVSKQLVEGWLGATRLAHDILPSQTSRDEPGLPDPIRLWAPIAPLARLGLKKKSEFV